MRPPPPLTRARRPTPSPKGGAAWRRAAAFAGAVILAGCVATPTSAPPRPSAPVEVSANPWGLPERPNVLLIVADDMGYADLGFLGDTDIDTPNLDRFFRANATFLRHYTEATCQPTRAGLMTGVHPAAIGFSAVGYALPDGVPTIAERLKERGYRTEHVGKWHLGHAVPEARPPALGFDEYFGFLDQGFLAGPVDGEWRHRRPTHIDPWLGHNESEPRQYRGHLTDLITDHAMERIEALGAAESPWFMNLWYYAPHDPLEPAERWVREDTPAGRYRALVEHLDDAVGQVLEALEASGAADETVVVFLSDNGGTNRYLDNNEPMPGQKVGYFEGGIRTPMAIRIPGMRGARRISRPVSYLDIVPTVLELSGAPLDDLLDGRSLLPALEGEPLIPTPMFWEVYSDILGYAFGVTSEDGRWHYGQDLFEGSEIMNDLATDPMGRVDLLGLPAYDDVRERLWDSYRDWHDRIRLLHDGSPAGDTIRLDSRDVQRTPGFNSVTWSFAIDPEAAESDALAAGSTTLAEQEGVGRVRLDDGRVTVELFGDVLEGSLGPMDVPAPDPSPARADGVPCRTVTVATYSEHPNILSDASLFRATLYVDGVAVDELEREGWTVEGHERLAPLIIHPAGGALTRYRVWTEYLREDDGLRLPGVERVTGGMC